MLSLASPGQIQIHETFGPNAKINLVAIPMRSTELPIQPAFSESTEWQHPMQLNKGRKPNTMHTQDLVHHYKYQCIRHFQNCIQNFSANYFPKSKKIQVTLFPKINK